ncbi:MAG: helix-turn-helix transcriptional regulator [Streptomyces sp.]|nr:helix-turn-helix transcriptional regulator [Streptomyces sp.]NUS89443.1 helix-turn-helix transcriptional regulator [Streptomyces sp.]
MPELSVGDATVAANIRHLRERRELSQGRVAELAEAAGYKLSEASLWGLENGRRYIKVADLCAVAAALDVAPEDLFRQDFASTDAPQAVTYQVVLDGDRLETVTANQSFVDDDEWINFYLRGERVFFAPAARVVCCRAAQEKA